MTEHTTDATGDALQRQDPPAPADGTSVPGGADAFDPQDLRRLAPEAVLYGHHDDLAYGSPLQHLYAEFFPRLRVVPGDA